MSVVPMPQPRVHRWTRAEFHQMSDLGWFQDQRVELIDGEIVDMPVPGNPHCVGTECVAEVLRGLFGPGHWVRVQMPLALSINSEPIPDVAVVPGTPRTFTGHPTNALLVVEVSDTTLSYDRNRKAPLYAQGGIADYWVVDLNGRQ